MRTYLSSSRRPTSGGVLPHVTLIRPQPGVRGDEFVNTLGFTGPVSATTADQARQLSQVAAGFDADGYKILCRPLLTQSVQVQAL